MTHRPSTNDQYSKLLNDIEKSLIKSHFPRSGGKEFLPLKSLESLLSRDIIQRDLPGASDDLIDFVDKKAKRTFATVVMTLPGYSRCSLTSVMESFQRHGFDDSCLPIEKHLKEQLAPCPDGCSGRHATALDVFHDSQLGRHISSFRRNQWTFLAPKFPLREESRALHDDCILPFTEFGGDPKDGTFGRVLRAKLRVDHQEAIPQSQASHISLFANPQNNTENGQDGESFDIYVAAKIFKAREEVSLPESEIPDPQSMWSGEANNLEGLPTSNCLKRHMAHAIGCFSSNGEYYVLMPWAAGGTLRSSGTRTLNPSYVAPLSRTSLSSI